jgi:hypothetical protein
MVYISATSLHYPEECNIHQPRSEVLTIATKKPRNVNPFGAPVEGEKDVRLSDMFGHDGRFGDLVMRRGRFLTLTYWYDFGVRPCLPTHYISALI